MRIRFKLIALLLVFLIAVTSVGVQATWLYADGSPDSVAYGLIMSMFPWTEFDKDEMMSVAEKFAAILNSELDISKTPVEINGVLYDDSFEALMAAFNDSDSINYRNDSYIGTMQEYGDDVAAIITMFDEAFAAEQRLNPHYDMMLKCQNFDNNTTTGVSFYVNGNNGYSGENQYAMGAEIVLFSTNVEITEDDLWRFIPVQATVFTRQPVGQKMHVYNGVSYPVYDYVMGYWFPTGYEIEVYYRDWQYYRTEDDTPIYVDWCDPVYDYTGNDWYQIGSYVGEAMVVYYSSGSYALSFSTDDWRSTEDYGYGVGLSLAQCVTNTLNQ